MTKQKITEGGTYFTYEALQQHNKEIRNQALREAAEVAQDIIEEERKEHKNTLSPLQEAYTKGRIGAYKNVKHAILSLIEEEGE